MTSCAPGITPGHACLAPSPPGLWDRGTVSVHRDRSVRPGAMAVGRGPHGITLRHNLAACDLSDALVESTTTAIAAAGGGRGEFETAMIGLVRTTVDDPSEAWAEFYRNSLHQLASGSASFAPIHDRAAHTAVGSVLDLGSCFGFFPLRLASSDPTRSVTATDIDPATIALLDHVAPLLGITLNTRTCDASALPFGDSSFDTVTALHLLEHVDAALGHRILGEACRVARRRVVVAVPYEDTPAVCHGHVRSFTAADLHRMGAELGLGHTVFDHHGGWLVIDVT